MIHCLRKNVIILFLFFILPSFIFSQAVPTQSAPVNNSIWETTTPTLYWWYMSNPFSMGPFDYSVQVSTNASDFSGSNLIVNATVHTSTAGSYSISPSAGITIGHTYYWRIGVGGNYSPVWNFSPSTWGGSGVTYYNISVVAGANGAISPLGPLSVAEGTNWIFTITPNPGYEIADVRVDNISVGVVTSYDMMNVTANHSIEATFQMVPIITYVSVSGNDMNGDGSQSNPYKTIQHGINRTDDGGTLFVFNGDYGEDVNISRPITIIGESNPSTSSFVIWESDVHIKNFVVYAAVGSGPGPGIQKRGFESWQYMENLSLENIECHNNEEQGLLLENIGNVSIKNCRFYDNHLDGIDLAFCDNVTIDNVGTEGNLRGLAAYKTNNLTLSQVYVEDNGLIPIANWPDLNGFTFTECNNILISSLYSNNNEEQGFKFEDCSHIDLENVTASHNKTDGMAFINCNEINYVGGFANNNGSAIGDNGAEFVKCTNFVLNNFSADDNFDKGIYLGSRYTGEYLYDGGLPGGSPWTNEFIGVCEYITFENVSADGNKNGDGLNIVHTNHGTFNNLTMTNNFHNGLNLESSLHSTFTNGTFDFNEIGVLIYPKNHIHRLSDNIFADEIISLSFLGSFSMSNNDDVGIGFKTDPAITIYNIADPFRNLPDSKIVEPFFNGNFKISNNGLAGMIVLGKVLAPSFYGMHFKAGAASMPGMVIQPMSGNEPKDVVINNSIFEGYLPSKLAINLGVVFDATKDVDAQHNIFAGATTSNDVEMLINHFQDNNNLGLVNFDGWSSGQSSFNIGSASGYAIDGALVTIPISISQPVLPITFDIIQGILEFNTVNLAYRYATTSTGTLLQDAGWTIIFDNTLGPNQLGFRATGYNAIATSGTLFYLTFEVLADADGSETISCDPANLYAGMLPAAINPNLFNVNNGIINYTTNTSTSFVKGDATLDGTVDNYDYNAVLLHINGLPKLVGQGLLNADVNTDGFVNILDLADITAFIGNGIWPNTPSNGSGSLLFASTSVDQNGLLRFPLTLSGVTNVRSLEVELTYDESKVDFRNYVQLMSGDKYHVDAKRISNGLTKLVFTATEASNGYIVPAEIMFNINGNPNAPTTISSSYSINGGDFKEGPKYSSNGVTGVESKLLPEGFTVSQNYPNPFNPSTSIEYAISKKGFVSIKVYDVLGRLVNTLVNEEQNAGFYKSTWNSVDDFGNKVSSGVYFYRVTNGANVVTKKMMLIK